MCCRSTGHGQMCVFPPAPPAHNLAHPHTQGRDGGAHICPGSLTVAVCGQLSVLTRSIVSPYAGLKFINSRPTKKSTSRLCQTSAANSIDAATRGEHERTIRSSLCLASTPCDWTRPLGSLISRFCRSFDSRTCDVAVYMLLLLATTIIGQKVGSRQHGKEIIEICQCGEAVDR